MNFRIQKNSYYKIFIVAFLLLNVMVMLFFGIKKNGYNVDELYTYGLSNSYYEPFINISENTELSSDYFKEYLTVQDNEKFAFKSVYDNQSRDVHPPFYYFLFHTIASFTPNVFSKWTGITLNIILFIACWLILLKISKLFLKDRYLSLLPSVIWGFSSGAISSIVFIRMYVLMTVFVLLTSYFHIKAMKLHTFNKSTLGWIYLITFLGVMTHYYYVIFACFVSIIYCVYLLYKKRLKYLAGYCLAMFGSLGSAVIFYPALIDHIFLGYRGTEAVTNISETTSSLQTTLLNFTAYYEILNTSLFSNSLNYLLFLFLLLIFLVIFKKNKKRQNERQENLWNKNKNNILMLMSLMFATGMYVFIVAQVAPYKADRYVFPMFPLIILTVVVIFVLLFSRFIKNKNVTFILLGIFTVFSLIYTYANGSVNYLYENRDISYLTDHENEINKQVALLFYDSSRVSGAQVTNSAQYLIYHDSSYIFNTETGIEEMKKLEQDKKRTIIYFGYVVDVKNFADEIIEKTSFTKYTLIDKSIGAYIFE